MSNGLSFQDKRLTSWREVMDAADYLTDHTWLFRGQERADWPLQTSLEREFGSKGADVERELLFYFVRRAGRLLPSHLVPSDDNDAAAWLGLIQHYGGPTRLLDVTISPYVALFFAFEPTGDNDRALWAIEYAWCTAGCAQLMADNEGLLFEEVCDRVTEAQAQLVYSLVHRQPHVDPMFKSFKPFTGVFPLDPWKPDARQSAQQAMFFGVANARVSFEDNLAALAQSTNKNVIYRFVLASSLREEALEQLSIMNVTAATLFPDLNGLARSLRTRTVRRPRKDWGAPPWEAKS